MKKQFTNRIKRMAAIGMAALGSMAVLTAADVKTRETKTGKVLQDTATGRKSADHTFDGRRNVAPVEVQRSTQTRNAEQISRQENAKEQSRQREESQKRGIDKIKVK